jgi:hypothetical protein
MHSYVGRYISCEYLEVKTPRFETTDKNDFSISILNTFYPQRTYTYRVQSSVWRLPNYWPPTPSAPSECVLPPHQSWGVHTRRSVRGWGVNISEDARHWIGLLQYNPFTYVAMQGAGHRWEGWDRWEGHWAFVSFEEGWSLHLCLSSFISGRERNRGPTFSPCTSVPYQEERGTEDPHSVLARLFPIRKSVASLHYNIYVKGCLE